MKIKESSTIQRSAVPSTKSTTSKRSAGTSVSLISIYYYPELTSRIQVSIKVEERDVKPSLTTDGKKPTSRARNDDLPEEFTENKAWRILMSSLFRYIATTDQVFNINDSVMLRSLQILCSHFYSNTGVTITITTSSPVFRLVSASLL